MKTRIVLAILLSLIVAIGLPVIGSARAAVTLIYFIAEADAPTNSIYLEWETATELNNAGFYITRSNLENGTYVRITDFIPAEGDGVTGSLYYFFDLNIQTGVRYWYKLEAVDTNNNSEFHGPISAQLGGPTPTSTLSGPTRTPTVTVTLPPGVTPSNTPTSTQTPIMSPTFTSVIPTRTVTPQPTNTPLVLNTTPTNLPGTTATDIPTPTQTLDVSPIELMFPAPTQQTVIQKVVTVVVVTEVAPGAIILEQSPMSVRGQLGLMFGIVILLWVVLGIFIVVYIRRLNS